MSSDATLNRRQLLKGMALGAIAFGVPRLSEGNSLPGTLINHISYQSADYKKTRDFYVDLLGFQASDEDDKQLYIWAGDALISAKNTPRATSPSMDHIGLTVDPWDQSAVQAALKERGLTAMMASNDPHDPKGPNQTIFTRDPFGYTVQLGAKDIEVKPAPVPSNSPLQAIGINHISYQCPDYKKVRDFYTDLLGVQVTKDDGTQAYLWIGDAFIVVRNSANKNAKPVIDHFAWTVAEWNKNRVATELTKRGLQAQSDPEGLSIITRDLNGYNLQLCSKDLEKHP
jgi:catechol 2,3-dioxygenase-like lactoylglutathione lyase family enzyme